MLNLAHQALLQFSLNNTCDCEHPVIMDQVFGAEMNRMENQRNINGLKAKIKKVAVGAVKKKTKKITEKTIQDKVKSVKKAALSLDDAQNAHMLQKIGALMQKPFMLKHFDGGKLKSVIKFNASNLATAKKIAKKHKEHQGHKGRYSVSAY